MTSRILSLKKDVSLTDQEYREIKRGHSEVIENSRRGLVKK